MTAKKGVQEYYYQPEQVINTGWWLLITLEHREIPLFKPK